MHGAIEGKLGLFLVKSHFFVMVDLQLLRMDRRIILLVFLLTSCTSDHPGGLAWVLTVITTLCDMTQSRDF